MSKYPKTRKEIKDKFYLLLTDEQIEKYAAMHPVTKRDLKKDICDTIDRDFLITYIVTDVLGEDRWWPINGDGIEFSMKFYPEFFAAANNKGLAVEPSILELYCKK